MNQPPLHPFLDDPYQQPPQLQARKKVPLWLMIVVLIALSLCACTLCVASLGNRYGRLPTMQSGTWTTTHTYSGGSTKTLAPIVVAGSWKLTWTCAPNSELQGYDVVVEVGYDDGGAIQPIYQHCDFSHLKGESVQESRGGTLTIEVISDGEWMINVQELE